MQRAIPAVVENLAAVDFYAAPGTVTACVVHHRATAALRSGFIAAGVWFCYFAQDFPFLCSIIAKHFGHVTASSRIVHEWVFILIGRGFE